MSIGKVGAAALLAQLLNFAAVPLLARIYEPGVLGVYFVLQSFVLPFSAAIALRWELAVPLPPRSRDALAVAVAAASAALACVLCAALAIFFFGDLLALGFNLSNSAVIWATPVLAGTIGAFMISNALAIRERRFGAVAARQVLVALVTVSGQALGGIIGGGPVTLLLASSCGFLSGSVYVALSSETLRAGPVSFAQVRRMAWRYRKFPLVLAPAGFLNSVSSNIPVALVGVYFTLEEAGQVGMAYKLVAAPVALIGIAVSQVFVGELSAIRRAAGAGAKNLFLGISSRLAPLGCAAGLVLFFVGPHLFVHLLGEEWRLAGEVARALSLVTAAQIVVAAVSEVLIVYERVGAQLALDLLRSGVAVAAVVCGVAIDVGLVAALWVLSGSLAGVYVIGWVVSLCILHKESARALPVDSNGGSSD